MKKMWINDVIKIVIMSPGWGQNIFELPKPNDFIQAAWGYIFLDEINNIFHPPPPPGFLMEAP